MKLSVEAKVAASVATGFVALTVGVIAEGNSREQSADPNGYTLTHNPEVNTYKSQPGYDSALTGRTYAEKNKHPTQWQARERL